LPGDRNRFIFVLDKLIDNGILLTIMGAIMNRQTVIQISKGAGLLFFFLSFLFRALNVYDNDNDLLTGLSPFINDIPPLSFIYILLSLVIIIGFLISFIPGQKNWDKFISVFGLSGLVFASLGTLALMNNNIDIINEFEPDYPPTLGLFFIFAFMSILLFSAGTILVSFESINVEKLLPFLFSSSQKKQDVFEELSKLKKLYDEKILSEEEFKQQKERLLNINK
jgi:uncharacterized membrane protein